jgi:hypothetical protein
MTTCDALWMVFKIVYVLGGVVAVMAVAFFAGRSYEYGRGKH